jgi:hypothetical protein
MKPDRRERPAAKASTPRLPPGGGAAEPGNRPRLTRHLISNHTGLMRLDVRVIA